jgi:hypothetical protein
VAYLLVHGADVFAQTSRGDNALHIAARQGNAGCLHALLTFSPPSVIADGPARLGDVVVQGDAGPTKFVDLHNGVGPDCMRSYACMRTQPRPSLKSVFFDPSLLPLTWILDLGLARVSLGPAPMRISMSL